MSVCNEFKGIIFAQEQIIVRTSLAVEKRITVTRKRLEKNK